MDIGLIDTLVSPDNAAVAAREFLHQELDAGRIPVAVGSRGIDDAGQQVFDEARALAARRRRGEKAPSEAISAIEAACKLPLAEGMAFERDAYQRCVAGPQAKAMRHMFFAERQALKGHASAEAAACPIQDAGIVGAGTMGTGIALAFLMKGFEVHVTDRVQDALDAGLERIRNTLQASAEKGRLARAQVEQMIGCLSGSVSLGDLGAADVIVEAAFEDMDVKKAIFAELAEVAKPCAVLASNTSYLDLDEIAKAAGPRARDVVGLHFFSPANIMPLLEIVRGAKTSEVALATALALSGSLGKTGVVSGVCHGFIANRSFSAYLREAEFLLQEGATPDQVDAALVAFGMPMGPFAVRDLAGLDIGWAKRKSTAHLRNPNERYSDVGDLICERGWFGQKTGRGFYLYPEGTRKGVPDPKVQALIDASAKAAGIKPRTISDQEIIERCLFAVVNEGARIVDEGIARRTSDVDVAWVNGYGFPRWRGGPMHWAEDVGLSNVLDRITHFNQAHDFWTPAALLQHLAQKGAGFDNMEKTPT
jgi:3-hydroxyacyl-CoA dehydrogenase